MASLDFALKTGFEGSTIDMSPMKVQLRTTLPAFMNSKKLPPVFRAPPGLEHEGPLLPPPGLENEGQLNLPKVKASVPAYGAPGIFAPKSGPPGFFMPAIQQAAYAPGNRFPCPPGNNKIQSVEPQPTCSVYQAAHTTRTTPTTMPSCTAPKDVTGQQKLDMHSGPKGRPATRHGKQSRKSISCEDSEKTNPQYTQILSTIQRSGADSLLTLQDVLPYILDLAKTKDGVQFLLARLGDTKQSTILLCQAVLTETSKLSSDPAGSLLIRKLFEVAGAEQQWALAVHLMSNVKQLSCDVNGCRVVQAALRHVSPDLQVQLAECLKENIVHCMRNIHGNHVVQLCVELLAPQSVDFIVSAINDWGADKASMHPYACRVVMRALEHCQEVQQVGEMRDVILKHMFTLAKDRYGNYVVQHILEHGSLVHKRQVIMGCIQGDLLEIATQKYAHNVLAKCLLLDKVAVTDALLSLPIESLANNRFGSMIVQSMLEASNDRSRAFLVQQLEIAKPLLADNEFATPILAVIDAGIQDYTEEVCNTSSSEDTGVPLE